MKLPDYYATLGVDKATSPEDLKKAFRRLARKYHPDVSKEPDAASRMTALNEANDVLSDPEKRKVYDQIGHEAWAKGARHVDDVRPPPGWNQGFDGAGAGSGFGQERSEFFEEMFGRAAQERSRHQSHRSGQGPERWDGQDQHADISLTLAEAFSGAKRALQLGGYQINANGELLPQARTLEVSIPAGVAQGQLIRLSGQGGTGFGGGKAGDLYLKVHIEPAEGYHVDGRDITMSVFVAPWEAAIGGEVEIKTFAGSLMVNVPSGSIAGRRLRLRGKGIPAGRGTGTAGDLYIELKIAVPSAVTEQQQQAWRALAQAYPGFEPRGC
jgi:curved DNA-binding protein